MHVDFNQADMGQLSTIINGDGHLLDELNSKDRDRKLANMIPIKCLT